MSDQKISQLTVVNALSGAEIIPLLQNGVTVGASAATLGNQLPASGVTAGNYTNANISVNAKGQITLAANGTGGSSGITAITGDGTAGTNGVLTVTKINGVTPATVATSGLYSDLASKPTLGTAAALAAGSASGVATLDSNGKVPLAQMNASVTGGMKFQSLWNASTNTPTLRSGTGTKGFYYKVSVAGTTTLDGISVWNIGDSAIFDGTTWDKIDGSQSVSAGTAGIVVNGGGSVVATGIAGDVVIPYAGTITSVELLADQVGSIVIDVWKAAYANYPPTVANTITGSALPSISGAIKSNSSTLTGWTVAVNAGDILRFNVNSATTVTRVMLVLNIIKA